jgi:hypothetical protein
MPSSITPTRCVDRRPQQRERQADVVVQVALRGEVRLGVPGAQDGRDHLRHRGLAVAAGHRDQRQPVLHAPGMGQRAERELAVLDLDAGHARGQLAGLGDRRDRALVARLGEEIVGVEALAPQRDEQVARLQRAGVGVHALHLHFTVAHQAATDPAGGLLQLEHGLAHLRASSRFA